MDDAPASPTSQRPRPARPHVQFPREPAYSIDSPRPSMQQVENGSLRRMRQSIDHIKETDGVNEASPLLSARMSKDLGPLPPLERLESLVSPSEDGEDDWQAETPYQFRQAEDKSSWYMLLLTLCMLG